jgi:hypothetical protein
VSPTIEKVDISSSIIGIENITFSAKYTPYRGHFKEEGFNALVIKNMCNGWVNNVVFKNMDLGLSLQNAHLSNITNIEFTSDFERGGHHGLWVTGNSNDNLISKFNFGNSFVHDISVESFASMNVFEKGKGINLNFDHHRVAPFGNLFTDINIGKGTRYFVSGGKPARGGRGARSTFWKLYTDNCTETTKKCELLPVPNKDWGTDLMFIGTFKPNNAFYVQTKMNNRFTPDNIYRTQLQK